jgi:predicted DNA-binding transcriptional regulator AlpA
MSLEHSSLEQAPPLVPSKRVVLSKWVNERPPPWGELLSAHHVARLTRRPRWLLLGMTLVGRFPRKQRYQGHHIGWLRSDVLAWIAKEALCIAHRGKKRAPQHPSRPTPNMGLPLGRTRCASHRDRGICLAARIRRP